MLLQSHDSARIGFGLRTLRVPLTSKIYIEVRQTQGQSLNLFFDVEYRKCPPEKKWHRQAKCLIAAAILTKTQALLHHVRVSGAGCVCSVHR